MKKNQYFILIFCLLLTGMFGCDEKENDTGSLAMKLSFNENYQSKNIRTALPDVDMSINAYEMFLSGPNGEAEAVNVDSSGIISIDELSIGEWQITVTAKNSAEIPIGSGQSIAVILARQVVNCEITVNPFEGEGGLNLTITWNSALVQSASIEGSLIPAITTNSQIDFSLSGGDNTYNNTVISAGYYTLIVTLYDNGIVCGGAVDIIRVITDQTTEASINVEASEGEGGAGIVIIPEMNDPIEIVLTDLVNSINEGESFTVIAEATNATEVFYSWYVDGLIKASGTTVSAYQVPTDLAIGFHRLDITIFTIDGLRGGSATHIFEVQ